MGGQVMASGPDDGVVVGAVAVQAHPDPGLGSPQERQQCTGNGEGVAAERGFDAARVHVRDQLRECRMRGRLAAAKLDAAHPAVDKPVESKSESCLIRMGAVGRRQAETAVGVATAGNSKADGGRELKGHLVSSLGPPSP